MTTLAGSSTASGSANGTGTAATFGYTQGLTNDGTNLYVVDFSNYSIRKIVISTGVVTTLAGSGTNATTDGTGTAAAFGGPKGITSDGTSLYVTEFTNTTIRKIE